MFYILAFESNIDAIIGPFDSEDAATEFRNHPAGQDHSASLAHIGGTIFQYDGTTPSHVVSPDSAMTHIWGINWSEAA